MPSATQSEATIANVLTAAEYLFVSRHYADVTMGHIAETAHVTKGALYHHFSSKEHLYLEMMHADLSAKKNLFARAIDEGGSSRDRLYQLTRAFLELPPNKRELIKLVRRDANVFDKPVRAELIRAYQSSLPASTERVMREGVETGELAPADPRLLSWQFIAMVEVTLSRHAGDLFRTTDDKLTYVLDLFFRGASGAVKREGGK